MKKKLRLNHLILILLVFALGLPILAQEKKAAMDTIKVKGRSFLILGDSSIYIEKDTIITLPDTIALKLKRDEMQRSEDFYTKIKEKLYKTRFTKELYDLLFTEAGNRNEKLEPVTQKINGNYQKHEGKRINRILIKKLEALGTNIEDTSKHYKSWAINATNDLHILTRSNIIKNNIFFEEGDIIDPDALSDSERVLRNLPYIKDARVVVIPRPGYEAVDVLIIVKDIWSITGDVDYDNIEKSSFSIIEKNFLGLGHELRNEFLYDSNDEPTIGYNGTYTINNIKNTFITGEFNYAHSEPLNRMGIRFFRNFITPEIKYAGGLEIGRNKVLLSQIFRDTTYNFYAEFDRQDIWFGRSWLLNEHECNGRVNLQIAGRAERTRFMDRPVVDKDTNQQFFDANRYLFSIGLSSRSYEKGTLILGYGRTEDIPKGYLLEFTGGREVNEFYDRPYLGWRFSLGNYFRKVGYVRPSLAMGGFIRKGRVEQGAVRLQMDYFSNLYRIKRINFRQFFRLHYTVGINRFDNEYVDINNMDGVRGLNDTFLRGTSKISLSSETVAFTPFYLVGFRFAIFAFADLAWVNANESKLLKNQLYQGYGLGLRLRNENLAFNTIQIRLAWYPVTPPTESAIGVDISGEVPLRIADFRIERPDVINFN